MKSEMANSREMIWHEIRQNIVAILVMALLGGLLATWLGSCISDGSKVVKDEYQEGWLLLNVWHGRRKLKWRGGGDEISESVSNKDKPQPMR